MNLDICPICETGKMIACVTPVTFKYRDQVTHLSHHYAECDSCEAILAGSGDCSQNKDQVLRFKASVDFGYEGGRMSIKVIRAFYDRSISPRGLPQHMWLMRLARMPGQNRTPRQKAGHQCFIGSGAACRK